MRRLRSKQSSEGMGLQFYVKDGPPKKQAKQLSRVGVMKNRRAGLKTVRLGRV